LFCFYCYLLFYYFISLFLLFLLILFIFICQPLDLLQFIAWIQTAAKADAMANVLGYAIGPLKVRNQILLALTTVGCNPNATSGNGTNQTSSSPGVTFLPLSLFFSR